MFNVSIAFFASLGFRVFIFIGRITRKPAFHIRTILSHLARHLRKKAPLNTIHTRIIQICEVSVSVFLHGTCVMNYIMKTYFFYKKYGSLATLCRPNYFRQLTLTCIKFVCLSAHLYQLLLR